MSYFHIRLWAIFFFKWQWFIHFFKFYPFGTQTLLGTYSQLSNDLSKDAQVLTLRPCEFNFIWKRDLYGCTLIEDLELFHAGLPKWDQNPVPRVFIRDRRRKVQYWRAGHMKTELLVRTMRSPSRVHFWPPKAWRDKERCHLSALRVWLCHVYVFRILASRTGHHIGGNLCWQPHNTLVRYPIH